MANLNQTLQAELFRALAMNLDYSPAADEIGFTAEVYAESLESIGLRDEDADRVLIAMRKILPRAERFPRVKEIIDALPDKNKAPALELKISPEQRAKNLDRISAISRNMAKGMKV